MKPLLIVLVGLPGSGKSEYATKLSEELSALHISASFMREMMFDDEHDTEHNKEMFAELYASIKNSLECKENVIFDATNLSSKRRHALNNYLSKVDCRKECHIVATPFAICVKNAMYNGVPFDVISKMYKSFVFPSAKFEGYDEVKIYYPDDSYMTYNGIPAEFMKLVMSYDQCNRHHPDTLGEHSLKTFNNVLALNGDMATLQAAALHDYGKSKCIEFLDKNGKPCKDARYYGHANVGSYESMFYDIQDRLETPLLISYHMLPYQFEENPNLIAKFRKGLGEETFKRLMILHEADKTRGEIKND